MAELKHVYLPEPVGLACEADLLVVARPAVVERLVLWIQTGNDRIRIWHIDHFGLPVLLDLDFDL
mgnify:CR=1 FL=1